MNIVHGTAPTSAILPAGAGERREDEASGQGALEAAPLQVGISEAPKNGKGYWVRAQDGVRLRVGHWKAAGRSHGTIFIFPGRTEYIEKYGRTVTDLVELGFSVLAIDWRGQGLADRTTGDRMKGHVAQFSDYQADVAAMTGFAEQNSLERPWYMLGHSLGACIGLRALLATSEFEACAFTSPMWDVYLPPMKRRAVGPVGRIARVLGLGTRYAPGTDATSYVLKTAFEDNRLTNDPDMYAYYLRQIRALPDYQLGGLTMAWLVETLKETRALRHEPSPDIPCLAFSGGQDEVIDLPAIEDRMSRWPGGRLELIGEGKHDLLSEWPHIRKGIVREIADHFTGARQKSN